MASALRQEWILIRRLGDSAAQLCVLPALRAGQLLGRIISAIRTCRRAASARIVGAKTPHHHD